MKTAICSSLLACSLVFATAHAADEPNARVPAPELQPTLPSKDNARVSSREPVAKEAVADPARGETVERGEERIESRLAVIRERGYTITDPNAGRYDRAASNGQRRVTPSMWQVFRF